jgi:hypothetical protein
MAIEITFCKRDSAPQQAQRPPARFQVNLARNERHRQAHEDFERTSSVASAVRHIDRTVEFLDLVTACHSFVAAVGRTDPGLRDRTLNEDALPAPGR